MGQSSPLHRAGSLLIFGVVCCLVAFCTGTALAQDAVITLPSGTAVTGVLDGTNLSLVERTVPPGEMHLFRAYDGSYRDPIVIVEGFDPDNSTVPADVYDMVNTWAGVDIVRAAGRSVWVVNFGDGGGALTANAQLVSAAVHTAANWGGLSGAKVDLIGLSMGGIVSRYALAWDEQHGGPSDGLVRLFVSGDSPQQGANGPPSLQEIVLFSADPELLPMLGCDAALSMLYVSVRDYEDNGCSLGALPDAQNWTGSSAAHDWFYTTLNSLNGDGYPAKSRNVAVANGSLSPQPHNVGDPIYTARTYLWIIQLCREVYPAYPMDVAPGSLGSDFAPGNIRQSNFQLDEHFIATFIPTESALDMRNGVSMFDRTLYQSEAQNHSTITTATTDFMLEEVLGPQRSYNPKYLPDGANASVYDWIVTAVFDGRFYIESPERTSGLLVISSESVQQGERLTARGTMSSVEGERRMTAAAIERRGMGSVPKALGMANRDLGGSSMGSYAPAVGDADGLNNVGLLVRTWGEVTQVAEGYLYIDDGSALKDGTQAGGVENMGVRVMCDPAGFAPGDYLTATGISSCFETPSGFARTLLTRSAGDIVRGHP